MTELQPHLQSIEALMHALQKDIDTNRVPLFNRLDQAYRLAAERIQIANPATHALEGLEDALASEETDKAFFHGLNNVELPSRLIPAHAQIAHTVQASFGRNDLLHFPYLQRMTNNKLDNAGNVSHWKSLQADLQANLPEDIQGLAYLELTMRQAFQLTRETARNFLDTRVKRSIVPGHEKDFFLKKMTGPEGTRFAKGYVTRIFPIVESRAEEIFGEDAKQALGIIRAIVYMETSRLAGKNVVLTSMRSPVLKALGEKYFELAHEYLRNFVLKYPYAFKQMTHDFVGVTEEDIAAYKRTQEEQVAERKAERAAEGIAKSMVEVEERRRIREERAQKLEQEQLEREARVKREIEERLHAEISDEAVQAARNHIGKAITWTSIKELPDGSQMNIPMIGYIYDETEGTHRHKNEMGESQRLYTPRFLIRTYIVERGHAQYVSTGALKTTTLMKRMTESQELPEPQRFAKGTTIFL